MFSKCIYCDKLHLCTSKEKYGRAYMTNSSWCEQIREAILPLIAEDARLKDLFLRWSLLGPNERAAIDEQIETRDRLDLYTPLKEAMVRWENVQETQGAPGFQPGVFSFSCDTRLEEELLNVMYRMDSLVDTVTSVSMNNDEQSDDNDIPCFSSDYSTEGCWNIASEPESQFSKFLNIAGEEFI